MNYSISNNKSYADKIDTLRKKFLIRIQVSGHTREELSVYLSDILSPDEWAMQPNLGSLTFTWFRNAEDATAYKLKFKGVCV